MAEDNRNKRKTKGGWPAVCCVLAAVLAALKLNGVIGWSWACVLAPLWVPAVPAAVLILSMLAAAGVKAAGELKKK